MKQSLKITLMLILFTATYSCNDVLDNAQPSTAISQNASLNSPGGVSAIRASMYDRLHSGTYSTTYMLGPSALADGLINRGTSTRLAGLVRNDLRSGMSSWFAAYNLINDANLLIKAIPEGVLSPETLAQYRGEAYTMRAFAMHHLVRAVGYEPGMTPSSGGGSGWTEGIILRTNPTLGVEDASYKPRSSVSTIYAQIISDLNNAIDLLNANGLSDPTYITVSAAQALMARVQLYARNYGLADQFATDALASTSARMATPGEVATMFDETTGLNPEAIFVSTVDPSTESLGVNNSLTVYTAQQYVAVVPTQELMDLYGNNDARLALFSPCFDETDGTFETGCFATHPQIPLPAGATGLEIDKWAGEPGQFADNVPFFRVSEMKLIQAEARIQTGGDALTPLNDVRVNRNESPFAGSDVMQAVLDERRREFAAEGQRFFDLKRLGRTIRKAPETLNAQINDIPYFDLRVLDDIPTGEVALSEANADPDSVLVQNPGYGS